MQFLTHSSARCSSEDTQNVAEPARGIVQSKAGEWEGDDLASDFRAFLPSQVLEELVTGDTELPPVNAVLGGILANEILKVVSQKGEPVNNFFFFSLMDNMGQIESLG